MSDESTLYGRAVRARRGRRPKAVDQARVCADSGCRTRLSRYNLGDTCYAHRHVRYPRLRGEVLRSPS